MGGREKPAVKAALLPRQERDQQFEGQDSATRSWCCGEAVVEEAKQQLWLAGPLIAVSMLQYCLQVISTMFVGHLGELPLADASMASSFASVTGFSVLLGMGSALETVCGQAYGAKQYHMLGVQTQRAMLTLLTLSVPLAIIWFNTGPILSSLRQDQDISTEAGHFNSWMVPGLFAYGILQCLNRFLQTQNNVFPMLVCSGITAVLHVGVCWALVFRSGLGGRGAALAISVSYWVNVLLLGIYIGFSPTCIKTWTGFSTEAFHDLLSFIKLAIPSAIMICFEYWSFEMVVLLSGLLPNPELETSVLSISLNTCWMVYMISVGLGGTISTRVSNELGAGHARRARLALRVMMAVALTEGLMLGMGTILVRHVWGRFYSNEEEVVKYVAKMMPLLALSDFLDGLQCVLSGAARGCGWQNLCAWINLGAYYVIAIPSAIILAFAFQVGGMVNIYPSLQVSLTLPTHILMNDSQGLWMGIICGLVVQNVALITLNLVTNWDREAREAILRAQSVG